MRTSILFILMFACLAKSTMAADFISHESCEVVLKSNDSYGFTYDRRWGVSDSTTLSAAWEQEAIDILWKKGYRPKIDGAASGSSIELSQELSGSYSSCYVKLSLVEHKTGYAPRTMAEVVSREDLLSKGVYGFFKECSSTRLRLIVNELPACKIKSAKELPLGDGSELSSAASAE